MGTSRKQRWIPVTLIEMAERIALHIRKEQERGNLMNYPPNLTSAQVLNMALARGLAKMAEEVGMDLSVSNQRNRRQEEEAGEKDRENERARSFLEADGGCGMSEKPFYTLRELAQILGLKPKSMYNLIYSGKLPARKWGRTWVVLKKDFEKYLEELPMAGKFSWRG